MINFKANFLPYKDNGYRYDNCHWKNNKLICKGLETGVKITPHEEFDKMFWVEFSEETYLKGKLHFGNIQQSKDAAVKLYVRSMNSIGPEGSQKARTAI